MSTGNTKNGCALIAIIGTIISGFTASFKSAPKAGIKAVKPSVVKPSFLKEATKNLDNLILQDYNKQDDIQKNR